MFILWEREEFELWVSCFEYTVIRQPGFPKAVWGSMKNFTDCVLLNFVSSHIFAQ